MDSTGAWLVVGYRRWINNTMSFVNYLLKNEVISCNIGIPKQNVPKIIKGFNFVWTLPLVYVKCILRTKIHQNGKYIPKV